MEEKKDVRKFDKNQIKKIGIGVVAVLLVGTFIIKMPIFKSTEVKVKKIEKGMLIDSNLYTGMISPGETRPIYVDANAMVEDIFVRVGEEISVGTELLTFSNQSLVENEKALKLNELDLKDIMLKIADQESGTMKLELDKRLLEIKELEENINVSAKKLPTLEREAKVFTELLKKDGVSSIEAEKKQQDYENLKVELELNRDKYNLMVVGYESLKRELDITKAKLESSLEKLKIENDTLKQRDKQLREPFVAPISGLITSIDAKIGEIVAPGQRILSIAVPGESRVILELPVYQVSSIKKGQDAIVISREDSNKRYKGKVEKVSSSAVSSKYGDNKVISIEISVTEKNDLRPGFLADVEISGEMKSTVPMVNTFSVIEENNNYYVFVNDNGRAKKQKVEIGLKTANNYEVKNLKEGTEVIVNPFKIKNGDKVKVVK